MANATYIQTPCIMVCRLNKDDICMGCYRTLDEIGAWSDADTKGRLKILDNISERYQFVDCEDQVR